MENDFCVNNLRAASIQRRTDVHAHHTSQTAFHVPARCRYSWRRFGDWHASLPMSGKEQSPVCLQPLLSNHIITSLKADIWQKHRRWTRQTCSSYCSGYYLITPLLLRDAGGGMQGVCLCRAIILPRWRVPPQLSPWNTKVNWLLRKQRAFKWRVTEQT